MSKIAKPMNMEQGRAFLRRMAEHVDEYAGIPMSIEDEQLVVHPSYRFAHVVNRKPTLVVDGEKEDASRFEIRNRWSSVEKGRDWVIFRDKLTGKIEFGAFHWLNRCTAQLNTLGIGVVWDVDCEARAAEKLASLVKPHALRTYMLTGSFMETSKRSGITYMFRRLRPTLAISTATGTARVLCGLCLHPIGFYSGTWAGCMVPTDEVVAHLLLMRGDEHCFWKQANQHAAWRPESGL